MSFLIKDKRKIALLRKCVQILTHEKEDFFMHFTKTHIRIFNMFKDDSTYMIDFQAPWFSKFMAPEVILNGELEILQIQMNRDVFLQSFNLIDDTELEFMTIFSNDADYGKLKVIKTRDLYIIEANVLFDIDKEIQCDESYNFPEDQLLLDSAAKHLKNIKGIFKKNCKQEIMELAFYEEQLVFKGELNNKFDYEIKTKNLGNHYGKYLNNGHEPADRFRINLALKHLLSLIKICDLIDGNFMSAMEQSGNDSCVTFLFTHSHQRDFKFIIGVGNVRFQKLDDQLMSSIHQQSRLRKQVNYGMPSAQVQTGVKMERQPTTGLGGPEGHQLMSQPNMKQEAVATEGNSIMAQTKMDDAATVSRQTAIDGIAEPPSRMVTGNEEQIHAAENNGQVQNGASRPQTDQQDQNMEDQDQRQKEEFYNQVDQQEFF